MLFRRTSPYSNINTRHPMLSYVVRHVRGGRSHQGTVRFAWIAFWIMLAAAVVPLLLFLWLFTPTYRSDYYWLESSAVYMLFASGAVLFIFPLVDFFAVFFSVNSIRSELYSGAKYDLLRTSTIPADDYVDARLALARVRAWRVMVFMWVGRLVAVGIWAVLGVLGLGVLLYEDGLNLSDFADLDFWFYAAFFIGFFLTALVQVLAEPLWRLDMLNAYAASVAVRYKSNAAIWSVLGFGYLVILLIYGLLGAVSVFGGVWISDVIGNFFPYQDYSWEFRDRMSMTFSFVPYMLLPFLTWNVTRWITSWRRRVTVRYILRHRGTDA